MNSINANTIGNPVACIPIADRTNTQTNVASSALITINADNTIQTSVDARVGLEAKRMMPMTGHIRTFPIDQSDIDRISRLLRLGATHQIRPFGLDSLPCIQTPPKR